MKYFAEKLENLGTVSLSIEIDDDLVDEIKISELNNQTLVLGCPGRFNEIIQLPCPVKGVNNQTILSRIFRLRLQALNAVDRKNLDLYKKQPFKAPVCKCGITIGETNVWKQLPSEHWAELMDLWHCHKPHIEHNSHEHDDDKSYTDGLYKLAMEGFQPKKGFSYYSDVYYLVHQDDLHPCFTESKIYKWDLGHSVSEIIGIQLKELVDAHAVFTFQINKELIVWVINLNCLYTCQSTSTPRKSVKIGFGDMAMKATKADPEEVEYPEPVYNKLVESLLESNESLPGNVRTLGEWKIAFL